MPSSGSHMIGSRIRAVGAFRPSAVVDNVTLAAGIGPPVDDAWILQRVGISSRRFATEGETVVTMAVAAAEKAIAGADLDRIGAVILATCTLPSPIPNGAASVASLLGVPDAAAFDVNAGCSGFCYALTVADSLIRGATSDQVLVIGAERLRDWIDPRDPITAPVFADGAGAVLVEKSGAADIGPVVWGSNGSLAELIRVQDWQGRVTMRGRDVYQWATSELVEVAQRACARAGLTADDVAAFVPHQANMRMIDKLAYAIGVHRAVIARDIRDSGNTSSASIPLALDRLRTDHPELSGTPALLLGFGAGLTYAAQIVRLP
ncbi:3-oxoacyl-ACP synthase [Nocardia vulneris]|uniref:3-oxoacyl-ACP synthase n=2 Tax=Nocardia vulneris TaxID=1141657 RepID=A0ABR4ZAJ5_9NOCA|nr:3-oxoacyl-ACP synthase [Nocardia vulneris]